MEFQPKIMRYESLPSTSTEAAQQAMAGAPEGLVVVAREQTAGRGRRIASGYRRLGPDSIAAFCCGQASIRRIGG